MSYQETLSHLFGLQKFGIKFGLSNITLLLKLLGNPHIGLKTVHIAGTNGKGSTAATAASILQDAGHKTGLYTSPHLVNFTERIRINGREITEDKVAELTDRIRFNIQHSEFKDELSKITFFEFTTAMALLYFAGEGVDIAVMETGMGGRLDATNVIRPLVSVITNVSLEHMEFLGDTVDTIASEKAGIIKERIPVVTGIKQASAFQVVEKVSDEREAPLYRLGRDFSFQRKGKNNFSYRGIKDSFDKLTLNLPGEHQFSNASLALAAVELLKDGRFRIPAEAISGGMEKVIWPGRLETVSRNPLIILDGAHNPAGAEALSKALKEDIEYNRLYLLLGIMADKDMDGIIAPLAPLAREVILSRPRYERASPASVLLPLAMNYNDRCSAFEELKEAIDYARSRAGGNDLIVISGSLFTVGEARAIIMKHSLLSGC